MTPDSSNASPAEPIGADALLMRGQALEDEGRPDVALQCYRQAVIDSPANPRTHLNVGNALRALHRNSEARAAFEEAIRLAPDHAHAHFNLALLYSVSGDFDAARAKLNDVMRLAPELAPKVLDAESYILFASGLRGDVAPEALAREHFRVGAAIEAAAPARFRDWPNFPEPRRKLRVGYVSGDFGLHPVALFLRPVVERHDRENFDIFCYSTSEKGVAASPIFHRLSTWREISGTDDREVARIIRSDAIDILVDLSGHTERNRLGVFAFHPAPVQATWLGYLNTTGLTAMDYRITDAWTDPPASTEALHTERLIRLPHSQWCYEPWGEVPTGPLPPTTAGKPVTFGSFNQFAKISDRALDLWARVLARVPDSRLIVFDVRDDRSRATLLDKLSSRGVARDRVDVRGRVALPDYYRGIGETDIALDTWPHNGATTTLDALWMGTPLVALRGDRGIARSSASILQTLGMTDLIAETAESYVDLNAALAADPARRADLRRTLRTRLTRSPLTDREAFVRSLEKAYRAMWATWCAAQAQPIARPGS